MPTPDSDPDLTVKVERRVEALVGGASRAETLGASIAALTPLVIAVLNADEFKHNPWTLVAMFGIIATVSIAYQALGTWARVRGAK